MAEKRCISLGSPGVLGRYEGRDGEVVEGLFEAWRVVGGGKREQIAEKGQGTWVGLGHLVEWWVIYVLAGTRWVGWACRSRVWGWMSGAMCLICRCAGQVCRGCRIENCARESRGRKAERRVEAVGIGHGRPLPWVGSWCGGGEVLMPCIPVYVLYIFLSSIYNIHIY